MRESQAIIERVRRIGSGWQHLALVAEDAALEHIKPGQSLLAITSHAYNPYLRENWVPIGFDSQQSVLLVERTLETAYNPGDVVSIIGPVGSPFILQPNIQRLLLVAQDYPPTRLLFLMYQALAAGISVTFILAGEAKSYPVGNLPPDVEVIHSDNLVNWPDQEKVLNWADQVYIVAESVFWQDRYVQVLYNAHKSRPVLPKGFLQVVFDLPFPCGTGACMACAVRTHEGNKLACLDGPAFDLASIKIL